MRKANAYRDELMAQGKAMLTVDKDRPGVVLTDVTGTMGHLAKALDMLGETGDDMWIDSAIGFTKEIEDTAKGLRKRLRNMRASARSSHGVRGR